MNRELKIKEIVNDTEQRYYFDDGTYLVDMMLAEEPIDKFQKLWSVEDNTDAWRQLLNMTCWEVGYERVGGDEGYLENPPINYERIKYLEELIVFLTSKGLADK